MSASAGNATGEAAKRISVVGFGEAGSTFVAGWRSAGLALDVQVYDIKTDSPDAAIRNGKLSDYQRAGLAGEASLASAVNGAGMIFSLVTADSAYDVARNLGGLDLAGALFFDCNSCAPGTKRRSAELVNAAGGRYVDAAIMAPVNPAGHQTPILISGPHAEAGLAALNGLDMRARIAEGALGTASSIKMIRSIMFKGMEALALECALAGRRAGVEAAVLASLDTSFPGIDWGKRFAYMLERAMTHGVRRAAEMREVAVTVAELGIEPLMSGPTAEWEQKVGDLNLDAKAVADGGYTALADRLLDGLGSATES